MSETYQNQWSEEATVDDIDDCYRLLLGRELGDDGIKFWSQRIANEQFTYAKLSALLPQVPRIGDRHEGESRAYLNLVLHP